MIKIGKLFYIHYTTILLFVVCWFTRHLELFALSYFSVFLHEIAHTVTAMLIGIEPSYIAFFPFGVNLRIKNRIIYSISDEILLYMSGPFFSAVAALFSQMLFSGFVFGKYLYWNNIGLFLFNLLPILPMDGGMVLKRIISDKFGGKTAQISLKCISYFLIFLLIILEIWLAVEKSFNFPLVFVIIFLTANIFTNNEKYSMNFVKELMYIKDKDEKEFAKASVYVVKDGFDKIRLAKNFCISKNYVIMKKDKNGRISGIITEREIIDSILKK